jgi:natural product precursor
MKNVKSLGKLSLKKETVARLNDAQMNELKGGSIYANTIKCYIQIKDIKPIPPCTISFNEVVVFH